MNIEFKIKPYTGLLADELYKILQLRSEVFVVEQNCVYQDIDGKDKDALHVIGYDEYKVVAYARVFPPGLYFDNTAIGRVVVKQDYRMHALGHKLMQEAIKGIKDKYYTDAITISAQLYLKKFYESHGFLQEGNTYLEDGIPHIKMHRK